MTGHAVGIAVIHFLAEFKLLGGVALEVRGDGRGFEVGTLDFGDSIEAAERGLHHDFAPDIERLILGSGVIRGSSFTAENGSTIHAGDSTTQGSYGTLTFTPALGSGSFDFQSGSSVILDINPGSTSDKLIFSGTGTNTLTPVSAEAFDLIDWSGLTGSPTFGSQFTTSILRDGSADNGSAWDLPDISGSGYFWDLSLFTTNGTIAIVVPEPGRCVLLLIGLMTLHLRRCR